MRRAALLVVVALAAGCGGSEEPEIAAPVELRASVSPRAHLFGDPVVATLTVAVDPRRVDPATLRVETRFRPYRRTEPVAVSRKRSGGRHVITYSYALQCADASCAPMQPERAFRFPPAQVRYGSGRADAVEWPTLIVASRLTQEDLVMPALDEPASPAASYRVPPGTIGGGLAAAAALLGAAGLVAALRPLTRRRAAVSVPLVRLTPLQRAVAEVERAAAGAHVGERRRALHGLALVLGESPLARDARRLAWQEATPEPPEMRELAAAARRAGGAA